AQHAHRHRDQELALVEPARLVDEARLEKRDDHEPAAERERPRLQEEDEQRDRCSFDAFLAKYRLDDPALGALALIVRGADTGARHLTAESPGLYAVASGFREISRDDHENMARQFPVY